MLAVDYEAPLVLVSILVAILASYTALSLADRVMHSTRNAARWWIAGGAIAMGIGIWSMHFIGMLAFRLPIPVGYDLELTLFSLTLPMLVSGLALWQASQPRLPARGLAAGAVLMGAGIAGMHYSGMAAMRMQPGIAYEAGLVVLSVAIAIIASAAALWIAFKLQRRVQDAHMLRAVAAVVMGFAIVGMHYTGMAAASFPPDSICMAARDGFSQDGLAILVIIVTGAVLTIALLTSVFDARLASSADGLASSQAIAEERQALLTSERSARQQAERMNLLKDEFLTTLSHELRTPLSAILGWSQILRSGARDEATLIKGLATIERNARAQAKLIDDLLDMSRIISGKIILEVQAVKPAAFIEAAMDAVRPAALAKQIRMENLSTADAGAMPGDFNRLQQVMWNLLSNAVKFTPRGGRIRIRLEPSDREIIIKVTDSGIGIDPLFLPYVFDRFRQADASTTRRYGGLGLGLAIVKQLVELHGGSIRAESEGENKGTTFVLGFPRHENTAIWAGQEYRGDHLQETDRAGFEPVDLSGITVVVIDDEPDALEVVRHLLQQCGARALTASNAEDGLALVRTELPDVIVSDIGMPDMDGFELLRRLRAVPDRRASDIPAIALTAFARDEDQNRAFEAGFTAYQTKPIEPSELVQKILTVARHGKRAVA
jgi:NO-binding membrane sensor protein with MHYT domain/CheY-like chemotaxis protein/nitrogen-specific signal transduction histidine kinase